MKRNVPLKATKPLKRKAIKKKPSPPSITSATRKKVNARSNGNCERCSIGNPAHIHHVRTKAAHPELRNDMDNLLRLCSHCHQMAHEIPLAFHQWFAKTYPDRSERIGLTAYLGIGEE